MRTGDGPGRFVWEGSYCSRPEPTENGLIGEDWGRAWEVCVGGVLLQPTRAHRERSDR